jgi:hypothetical protein
VVRVNDIVINGFIAWGKRSSDKSRAYDFPDGVVISRFEEIPGLVAEAVKKLGVRPENTIVT